MTVKIQELTSPLLRSDLKSVLNRTRDIWDQFRGQRIFITGGTGFFGKWLLETFAYADAALELRAELVVLTRDRNRFLRAMPYLSACENIRFQQGDVRDFNYPSGEFSHVIHAATEASAALNHSAPDTMFDVIVKGTRRVLDFSEHCGAQRILMVSSGAVYGRAPKGTRHIHEEDFGTFEPLPATSAYCQGKRVAEQLCVETQARNGINIPIARCFAFVGPFLPLDQHFAIGNFLRDALLGGPVVMNSRGQDFRSYMYAADLATWLWTMLARVDGCRAFNVGSDHPVSISELARSIACLGNTDIELRCGDTETCQNPTHYVPSIERARRELGLDLEVDFHSSVARTFAWHRQRRAVPSAMENLECA
jgi:dTDP-glucose 4,6-dehydratase